jgi:predicted cupin superfamily sugar epimerase
VLTNFAWRRVGSAGTRVGAALRMAATSLRHSEPAIGAYYRQIARRKAADVAVFATARKLATIIYRLLRWVSRTLMRVWRHTKSDTRRVASKI